MRGLLVLAKWLCLRRSALLPSSKVPPLPSPSPATEPTLLAWKPQIQCLVTDLGPIVDEFGGRPASHKSRPLAADGDEQGVQAGPLQNLQCRPEIQSRAYHRDRRNGGHRLLGTGRHPLALGHLPDLRGPDQA